MASKQGKDISRRGFLRNSAWAAGAGLGALALGTRSSMVSGAVAPSDKITVGYIATGARPQQIMDAMLTVPQFEIVAVCDAYKGRVARAIERCGGRPKAYDDYTKILGDKSIDAVVIATPDHWHIQMAIEAIQAGKDVYIEKPLTFTVDEGVKLIEAVKGSDRILQVGSQGISTNAQKKAKEVIASGKLGQVTMVRAYYNRNTAGGAWIYPIPPDANEQTVDWKQFLGSAPAQPFNLERFFRWRCYKDYSGGIPTDLFVHLATTIHFVMNVAAPSMVMGMGGLYRWKSSRDVADTVNASLAYREGFMVNMSTTFNNTLSAGDGFQVLGTEGSLVIGENLTFTPETPMEDDRWVVRSWPSQLEQAYYADPKLIAYETAAKAREAAAKSEQIPFEPGDESTLAHVKSWLAAIQSRKQPYECVEVGHRAAAVAHMVNRSIQTQSAVLWDFDKQLIKA
ncbi:Gfo/Idh/MocA family oxidoreductase [bacterium]|nr:Gfo/Idh/MocA family oxidoreductase [bacterium]